MAKKDKKPVYWSGEITKEIKEEQKKEKPTKKVPVDMYVRPKGE